MSAGDYRLEIVASAARELEAVEPLRNRRLVVARIRALAAEPRPSGALKLSGLARYRVRQGSDRVLYEIDDAARVVRVVKIGHRRDVYRER